MEVDRINSRSNEVRGKRVETGLPGFNPICKMLARSRRSKHSNWDWRQGLWRWPCHSSPAICRNVNASSEGNSSRCEHRTGSIFRDHRGSVPAGTICVLCFVTTTNLAMIYGGASRFFAILPCISVMARVILFVLLCRSARDEQRFILKLMSKCVAVLLWLFVGVVVLSPFSARLESQSGSSTLGSWLRIVAYLPLLYIALLGIRGTAKLPLGVRVLQVVFGRGRKAFLVCRRREEFSFDSESDSIWSWHGVKEHLNFGTTKRVELPLQIC